VTGKDKEELPERREPAAEPRPEPHATTPAGEHKP
jgi:hypothetical protein